MLYATSSQLERVGNVETEGDIRSLNRLLQIARVKALWWGPLNGEPRRPVRIATVMSSLMWSADEFERSVQAGIGSMSWIVATMRPSTWRIRL